MKLYLVGMPGSMSKVRESELYLLPCSVNWEKGELKRTLRILASFDSHYTKVAFIEIRGQLYLRAYAGENPCDLYNIKCNVAVSRNIRAKLKQTI